MSSCTYSQYLLWVCESETWKSYVDSDDPTVTIGTLEERTEGMTAN
jgi:hypothetical protein